MGSPETLLPAGSRGGGGGNDLEDSVPRVLQLLGDVRRRAVEVGGDAAARVRGQREELRAKVSVGDVLGGRVGAAVGGVVAARRRQPLLAHVHLEVREEVAVVARRRGREQVRDGSGRRGALGG